MTNLTFKVLFISFFTTVFFLFNMSYKSSHNGTSFIDSITQSKIIENSQLNTLNKNKEKKITPTLLPATKEMVTPSINTCLVYGPVLFDNKNVIDILLNKAHLTSLFNTIEKPVFEVFWNLGKDKVKAIELFEVQKNDGPLKEEKYKLAINEDNDWVVSISKIIANETMARDLATNLAIKANKIKTGGRWQYRNKSSIYFYQTNYSTQIPKEVNDVMEKTFSISKNNCDIM